MLIAGSTNFVQHELVHFPGEIVVGLWPHPVANLIGERSAFVDVEQIKR